MTTVYVCALPALPYKHKYTVVFDRPQRTTYRTHGTYDYYGVVQYFHGLSLLLLLFKCLQLVRGRVKNLAEGIGSRCRWCVGRARKWMDPLSTEYNDLKSTQKDVFTKFVTRGNITFVSPPQKKSSDITLYFRPSKILPPLKLLLLLPLWATAPSSPPLNNPLKCMLSRVLTDS